MAKDAKDKPLQISGKNLAALCAPDACPRCFWIKNRVKLPYQTFPGIFSSIDSHVKNCVHSVFDATGRAPEWLPEFGDAVRYLPAPHWQKFKRVDPATGICVTGVVDDLLECADGSVIIPDYKTARYTDGQDKLLPVYGGQLNAYRWIHEGLGGRVRRLALVYCEPQTETTILHGQGYALAFTPKTVPVAADDALVPALLVRAHEILTGPLPAAQGGCDECEKLGALVGHIEGRAA